MTLHIKINCTLSSFQENEHFHAIILLINKELCESKMILKSITNIIYMYDMRFEIFIENTVSHSLAKT